MAVKKLASAGAGAPDMNAIIAAAVAQALAGAGAPAVAAPAKPKAKKAEKIATFVSARVGMKANDAGTPTWKGIFLTERDENGREREIFVGERKVKGILQFADIARTL